ncbi:MAG: hypothetical protein ACOX3K_04350 [Bacilli bacterium]|jgi:hypothetical protein
MKNKTRLVSATLLSTLTIMATLLTCTYNKGSYHFTPVHAEVVNGTLTVDKDTWVKVSDNSGHILTTLGNKIIFSKTYPSQAVFLPDDTNLLKLPTNNEISNTVLFRNPIQTIHSMTINYTTDDPTAKLNVYFSHTQDHTPEYTMVGPIESGVPFTPNAGQENNRYPAINTTGATTLTNTLYIQSIVIIYSCS